MKIKIKIKTKTKLKQKNLLVKIKVVLTPGLKKYNIKLIYELKNKILLNNYLSRLKFLNSFLKCKIFNYIKYKVLY